MKRNKVSGSPMRRMASNYAKNYLPLTDEEVRAYGKTNDPAAREKLTLHALQYVHLIKRSELYFRAKRRGLLPEDILQAAAEGVMQACKEFEPDKGQLRAFCFINMQNNVRNLIAYQGPQVRVARTLGSAISILDRILEMMHLLGRKPTEQEIEKRGLKTKRAKEILGKLSDDYGKEREKWESLYLEFKNSHGLGTIDGLIYEGDETMQLKEVIRDPTGDNRIGAHIELMEIFRRDDITAQEKGILARCAVGFELQEIAGDRKLFSRTITKQAVKSRKDRILERLAEKTGRKKPGREFWSLEHKRRYLLEAGVPQMGLHAISDKTLSQVSGTNLQTIVDILKEEKMIGSIDDELLKEGNHAIKRNGSRAMDKTWLKGKRKAA